MDGVAEAALVLDQLLQLVERAAGPALDPGPPQVDQLLGRRGRRKSGQALAHHHGDRLLDRSVGAIGDLVELAAMELVVEHGRQIMRHPLHAPGADRLDAGLLDRLEHRARLLPARNQPAMHEGVVAGHAQGDRIGVAAHDGGVGARELAGRLGQTRLAAHHAGPLGGKRHFELGMARDRAQAAGHRALERLGRGFLAGAFGLAVGRHQKSISVSFPRRPCSPPPASEASGGEGLGVGGAAGTEQA